MTTRVLPAGIVQMQSPELINHYLDCLSDAFRHLATISNQAIDQLSETEQVSDMITHLEIMALGSLFAALKDKFRFNAQLPEIDQAPLYMCQTGSGMPAMSELLSTRNARKNAEAMLEKLGPVEKTQQDILQSILSDKSLPFSHLHKLSMRRYYQRLIDDYVFSASRDAVLEAEDTLPDGRRLLHWSAFDPELNLPVVYLVEFRYSGKAELTPQSELLEWLNQYVQGKAFATLKLVHFAKEFDLRFEDVHPLSIKRIIMGPFYMHNVTEHNDQIARILEPIRNPNDQWLMVCSTETLLSKGERTIKKGFFGSQIEQIYDVDHQDFSQFNAGATRIQQDVFLPYEAYQILQEQPDNPIFQYNKYLTFDH
jgi:hypothetical protein